jgi:protein-disulfide isomerase
MRSRVWRFLLFGAVGAIVSAPVAAGRGLPSVELSIAGALVQGAPTATLAIVEFSDFQCPFCARYAREAYPQLVSEFVDSGRVKYVFRHLPLDSIHPNAVKAAQASECASDQGKFWEMRALLFANPQALDAAALVRHAQTVGLDPLKFQSCQGGAVPARIRTDVTDALLLGVDSTPTFFIGTIQPNGSVKLLRKIAGSQPYATFRSTLQGLLASPEAR